MRIGLRVKNHLQTLLIHQTHQALLQAVALHRVVAHLHQEIQAEAQAVEALQALGKDFMNLSSKA